MKKTKQFHCLFETTKQDKGFKVFTLFHGLSFLSTKMEKKKYTVENHWEKMEKINKSHIE